MTADRATVADLARTSGLELLRFAYLLCGDHQRAEYLLQDVLLAMYRRYPGALPLDNPVGYARRALANGNISRARRRSTSEVVVDLFPESADPRRDDPAERDALWRALRKLPDRQRTVLVLRSYADATDEDIAETLHCRRGTVRSLASRALAALRTDPTLGTDGTGDQGAPPGCNGCQITPKSATVLVYGRGRFHLGSGWRPTTVAGHSAWIGTSAWGQGYEVPSIAWEFRPGEWAVVQGLTGAANSVTQLRRIADAVRPTQEIPIELPFRLGYVPGLPITSIEDDRVSGYAFTVTLGTFGVTASHEVDITIWPTRRPVNFDTSGAVERTVGGLPGYLAAQDGLGVVYHDGFLDIGTQGTPAGTLSRIADNLTWAHGDGRAPGIPAESAIP